MSQDSFYQPPIPSLKEGDFTLSFNRGEGGDILLLLSFPGLRGPMYPLTGYPKITEFRAMLAALNPDSPKRRWEGGALPGLCGSVRGRQGQGLLVPCAPKRHHVWPVREGVEGGASVVSPRVVVPEIRMAWDALTLEYGEL